MKKINELTLKDIEKLRKKPMYVPKENKDKVLYNPTEEEIKGAISHLQTLYEGKVYQTFASRILILHELYPHIGNNNVSEFESLNEDEIWELNGILYDMFNVEATEELDYALECYVK